MRWRTGAVAVAVIAGLALATGVAQAATLTVTTTTDSSAPGSGSLRAQIAAASPGDTVMLPASSKPYMVTLGEIPIATAITIEGASAGTSVIDANHLNRVFEMMSEVPSGGTVTFENLTIENGAVTAAPGGGGILVDSGGLALTGVTMTGNTVDASPSIKDVGGGAVYSNAGGPGITVTGSKLTGNSATVADPAGNSFGGSAIYQNGVAPIAISSSTVSSNATTISGATCCDGGAVYLNANSTITVTNSHLDDNTFTETGGTDCCSGGAAVYNDGGSASTVTITGSTLNGNTANVNDSSCCDGGGALYMDGGGALTLTLTGDQLDHDATTVTSGDCCSGGGAISSFKTIDATDSTFLSDSATVTDASCCDGGGAVLIDDSQTQSTFVGSEFAGNSTSVTSATPGDDCCNGGGAINSDSSLGTLTLSSSDVSGNTAGGNSTDQSGGGGLWIDDGGGNTLTNSTLSGNTTSVTGASDGGGAIALIAGTTKLSFATIAGNTATKAPGGGIFNDGEIVDTKNSIVASNAGVSGADCGGTSSPTFTSLGYNLEDSPDSCGFTQPTDKVVADATLGLGPLANNGGPTMTRALLAGSPAINAIPFADCTDQSSPTPQPITMDQRGVIRPQPAGGNCDIGAYEFGDVSLATTPPRPIPLKPYDGSTTTISFEVVNAGPAPATHTTATWTLPAGLKFVSGTASGGSCAATATGASCPLGVVSVDAPASDTTSSIILRPTKPAGDLTSKLVVTATEPNTTPSGDTQYVNIASIGVTPTIKQPKQSHKTWRESGHGHGPPLGTKFSFKLNEPAKLGLKFTGKHGKSAGTLSANGRAGSNTIKFAGRLSHKKKLKPGRYTVAITAKAEGKTSRPVKLSFTIAPA